MKTLDEFSSTPLALGTMVGIRSFGVDDDGMLTGSLSDTRGLTYQPGTNEAVCVRLGQLDRMFRRAWEFQGEEPHDWQTCTQEGCWSCSHRREHRLAGTGCGCGFWAYNDPRHIGRNAPEGLIGVFEGFGHVTYGPYGFRSSKGRVLALVREQPGAAARLYGRVRRGAGRVRAVPALVATVVRKMPWVVVPGALLGASVGALVSGGSPVAALVGALVGVALPLAAVLAFLTAIFFSVSERRRPSRKVIPVEVTATLYDVPVFDTIEQALQAFPPTRPDL